ncbi:MAG: hypothetical protein KF861_19565 [Planctomycetaceae bacterium]|nr:hypothetical protein [Planctomycetaceae bacterium]
MAIAGEHLQIYRTYESGDLEAAIRLAKTYLRRHKDDGRGWELLGLIQYARGRFAVSVSALERAALIVPLRPAARVCLGYGYAKIGRKALSRDVLASLIEDESLSSSLLLQVGVGLDAVDAPRLAMAACRRASASDPLAPQPYYDMGYYASRCGYPPRVTESLAKKALSLDPQNATYRMGLASLLMRLHRREDAYAQAQQLDEAQIESVTCRCCLERIAELFESVSDYRRALLCRQRLLALELNGSDSDCL